jgi:flagellar hook-basal body complex protein FliE
MSGIDSSAIQAEMQRLASQARAGGVDNSSASQAVGQGGGDEEGVGFAELLKQSIDRVDDMQKTSGELKSAFQAGDPDVALSDVMIASEKAGLAFDTMKEARNKLLEAYQKIQNMQV